MISPAALDDVAGPSPSANSRKLRFLMTDNRVFQPMRSEPAENPECLKGKPSKIKAESSQHFSPAKAGNA